tara:strand:- start:16 stop:1323 length:1308 start_codon:yes stop_codon:yes gene_type:complete
MSWQNILKAPPPMQPVGDGKFAPLSFTQAQSIDESELNPDELADRLNAYDLDVKILDHKSGEIDPSIRHIIADEHGFSKEVFSQSAKGSGKYIWRGLRMVTERPMGSGKINELREKFPEWHITMTRNNIVQDAERMKQHPEAVEYYFSPKQELITGRQKKYPTRPKKYGKNRRTMIQYKRYLEEGREAGILNPDETVNREKFKQYFAKRIKAHQPSIKLHSFDELTDFEKRAMRQFEPDLDYINRFTYRKGDGIRQEIQKNRNIYLSVLRTIYSEKLLKLLNDEKTLNALIGQFSGTAITLGELFSDYTIRVRGSMQEDIAEALVTAKKDSEWTKLDDMVKTAQRYIDKHKRQFAAYKRRIAEQGIPERPKKKESPNFKFDTQERLDFLRRRLKNAKKNLPKRSWKRIEQEIKDIENRMSNKKASMWFETIRGIQ